MCIVGVKAKGVQFPTEKEIRNCISSNPDGTAMAWNEGGKIHVFKSMSAEKFVAKYLKMVKRCKAEDTALVFHARIATHGSTGLKNCHCWEGGGLAFAHNGILSVANRGDMTDSETFFRDIFLPIYNASGWKAAEKAIDACIGSSKFAFLDKNGRVWMYGHYQTQKDVNGKKMCWSNSSYEDRSYPVYSRGVVYGGNDSLFTPRSKYASKSYGGSEERQMYLHDDFDWESRFSELGFDF